MSYIKDIVQVNVKKNQVDVNALDENRAWFSFLFTQ